MNNVIKRLSKQLTLHLRLIKYNNFNKFYINFYNLMLFIKDEFVMKIVSILMLSADYSYLKTVFLNEHNNSFL